MVQRTEVVLPLLETKLAKIIEHVTYPIFGSGFRLRFETVPPQHEVEAIADGLAAAACKASDGRTYISIDDSIGNDFIYTIKDDQSSIHYRVFSCHVYTRPPQPKENYPAVAVLKDPDCPNGVLAQKIIEEYETYFRKLKTPDELESK